VVHDGQGANRHLDKALQNRLPELVPVVPAEAQLQINAWDTAMRGIVLGHFEWDASARTFIYPADAQRIQVGDSYRAIANWLLNDTVGNDYRQRIDLRIDREFGVLGSILHEPPARQAAVALQHAKVLKLFDMVLELLKRYCFPEVVLDAGVRMYPPDHTMIRRLQYSVRTSYLPRVLQIARVTDADVRAMLAHHLHKYVTFVGPATGNKPANAVDERWRQQRVLQILPRTAQNIFPAARSNPEEVLREAFSLQWFENRFGAAEELTTLFLHDDNVPKLSSAFEETDPSRGVQAAGTDAPAANLAAGDGHPSLVVPLTPDEKLS
jgi:hypothetical protein